MKLSLENWRAIDHNFPFFHHPRVLRFQLGNNLRIWESKRGEINFLAARRLYSKIWNSLKDCCCKNIQHCFLLRAKTMLQC